MQSDFIVQFIRNITQYMRISCDVAVQADEAGSVRVAVQAAEDGKLLIGKNGQNLKALEHVVRMAWLRQNPDQRALVLDVNDYRAEQAQGLVRLVHETAERVRETRKSEALEPMSSYERRIVHTELAVYSDLATESVGQDPHRRVVIKPL